MKKLILIFSLLLCGSAFAQNSGVQIQGPFAVNDCTQIVNRLLIKSTGAPCSSGTPTGAAGGSLKGTYPNPGLADVNSIATSLAIGGASGVHALSIYGGPGVAGPQAVFYQDGVSIGGMLSNSQLNGGTGSDFALVTGVGRGLHFYTNDGAVNVDRMAITSGGNVGIGTTGPGQKLVVGNITGQNTLRINGLSTADMAPVLSLLRSGAREAVIAQTLGAGFVIANTGGLANYNDATIDAAANLVINNLGYVGIGTTAPSSTLQVAGNITIPGAAAPILTTVTTVTSGAAAAVGTLTNAPAAGNPTKWIPFNDAGVTRYIPAW